MSGNFKFPVMSLYSLMLKILISYDRMMRNVFASFEETTYSTQSTSVEIRGFFAVFRYNSLHAPKRGCNILQSSIVTPLYSVDVLSESFVIPPKFSAPSPPWRLIMTAS